METNTHKNFSLKEALKYGFTTYGKNIGLMLGATGLYCLYVSSFALVGFLAYKLLSMFAPNKVTFIDVYNSFTSSNTVALKNLMTNLKNSPKDWAALGGSIAIAGIWGFIINTLAMGGITKISLQLFEKGSASLSDFFISGREFLRYFKATMLFALLLIIGLICFVLPCFWVLAVFLFAPIIALDNPIKTISAFKQSKSITYGNRWKILLIVMLVPMIGQSIGLMLSFISPLIPNIISLLLMPLGTLIWVYVYKTLKVQTANLEA